MYTRQILAAKMWPEQKLWYFAVDCCSVMYNMGGPRPNLGHILMAHISRTNWKIELEFLVKFYHISSNNWYENHGNLRGWVTSSVSWHGMTLQVTWKLRANHAIFCTTFVAFSKLRTHMINMLNLATFDAACNICCTV